MRMEEAVELGSAISIQAIMTSNPASQPKRYPTYFGASGDQGCYGKNGALSWKNWIKRIDLSSSSEWSWQGEYINAIATSGGNAYLFQGAKLENGQTAAAASAPAERWAVGGSAHDDYTGISQRTMTGEYHAARFYNRALTEAELAQNLKVDEIRYRGNFANYANLTVVNGTVGDTGVTGESSVADGAYELIGTTTFTTEMKIIDGNKYYPKYIVETYSDGVWTTTASGMSESCTLTAGESPIRLTWQWVKRGFMVIVY